MQKLARIGASTVVLLATCANFVVAEVSFFPEVAGFDAPLGVTHAGDGTDRLFVASQEGRIWVRHRGEAPSVFLDLQPLVECCGERGLLGFAFHPAYGSNGRFFVHYSRASEVAADVGDTVIAEYRVSSNPDVAQPAAVDTILVVDQPFANHNGGTIEFGPDGYLYLALGDGGGGGDPQDNAQNLGSLLGKILRLDVDAGQTPSRRYGIPTGNPFVGTQGARPEIWAFGLRNPFRAGFDRRTGDLFIGDVGQGLWEEIDLQTVAEGGGRNYGWDRMEGKHCYDPVENCRTPELILPVLEYDHGNGRCAVTGGYRYRGTAVPELTGLYLYGDFCSGEIFAAFPNPQGIWRSTLLRDTSFGVSGFGEDEAGELYVTDLFQGGVARIGRRLAPPVFRDDFQDGDRSSWSFFSGGWADSARVLRGNAQGGVATAVAPGPACTFCFVAGTIRILSPGGRVSLVGWWQDALNYVELIADADRDLWTLRQVVGGTVVARRAVASPIDPLALYRVTVQYAGTEFAVTVVGGPRFDLPAERFPSGVAGFRLRQARGALRQLVVR